MLNKPAPHTGKPHTKRAYIAHLQADNMRNYFSQDIQFLFSHMTTIKILLIGITFLLSLTINCELYANNIKYLESGIEVRIPSSIDVEPGNFGTMVFVFRNPTNVTSSLQISFSSKLGWPLLGGKEHILLKPGQEEYLVLSTMAPTKAVYGTDETIKLIVNDGPQESDVYIFTSTVTVKMLQKLSLEAPDRVQGRAGTTIKIPASLFNEGSIEETPTYSVSSESGWEINWEIPKPNLPPGESLNTFLNCKIPDTALVGQTDYLNLKTISENGETEERRILIIVSESAGKTRSATDLTIPLYSNINLSLRSPEENGNMPWLGGVRLSGDIHPQLNMDFFFSGDSENEDSTIPSSLYLALTGEAWMMRTGAFDSGWDGIIDAPTSTALFYLKKQTNESERANPDTLINKKGAWHFWVGSGNEVFSSPQWLGASLEKPEEDLTFNFLHSMNEDSLYTNAIEARYTPAEFFSDPKWEFNISGAAGAGTDDSHLLSQSKISLSRYQPKWHLTGEITSGDEFYQTLTDTKKFTELTLSSEIEATHLLSLEPFFKYRLTKNSIGNKRITRTYQTNLLIGENHLLFRHEDDDLETTNELEIGIWNELETDKTAILTMELSNSEPHSSAARATNKNKPAKTFSLTFKTRDKLSSVDYLESYIDHSWIRDGNEKTTRSGFGLRWNFSYYPKWQNDGFLQINTPTDQEIHEISSQINIGYRITPSTILKLGNILLLGAEDSKYRIGLYLLHQDLFLLPVPWGGIRGKVFSDHNLNNEFDYSDEGVPNIHIYLDGQKKTVTTNDGTWMIPRVKPGSHKITIEYANADLSHKFSSGKNEYHVEIQPNTMAGIDIPLYPALEIRGLLFSDENKNNTPDPNERFLSDVILCLYKADEGAEQIPVEVTTQFDGSFFFNLYPGDYLIKVRPETLPEEIEAPEPIHLTVNKDTIPLILVALSPKEKKIEFPNIDFPEELLEDLQ